MNFSQQLMIDVPSLLNMKGLVHSYVFDKHGILLAASPLQLEILKAHFQVQHTDFIGKTLREIFSGMFGNAVDIALEQNEAVMQEKCARLYFNTLEVNGGLQLKIVTLKFPFYDEKGRLGGIVGISIYLSRVHFSTNLLKKMTSREAQCLNLLLENKTNKEIAAALKLSVRTIDSYMENIRSKLGCFSREEVIARILINKENFIDRVDSPEEGKMISSWEDSP